MVLFYKMCLEAMDKLTQITRTLEGETDYKLRDSINYASTKKDTEVNPFKLIQELTKKTSHKA